MAALGRGGSEVEQHLDQVEYVHLAVAVNVRRIARGACGLPEAQQQVDSPPPPLRVVAADGPFNRITRSTYPFYPRQGPRPLRRSKRGNEPAGSAAAGAPARRCGNRATSGGNPPKPAVPAMPGRRKEEKEGPAQTGPRATSPRPNNRITRSRYPIMDLLSTPVCQLFRGRGPPPGD